MHWLGRGERAHLGNTVGPHPLKLRKNQFHVEHQMGREYDSVNNFDTREKEEASLIPKSPYAGPLSVLFPWAGGPQNQVLISLTAASPPSVSSANRWLAATQRR